MDVIIKVIIVVENLIINYMFDFVEVGIIVLVGYLNVIYEVVKVVFYKGVSFVIYLYNVMLLISFGWVMGVVGVVLDSDVYIGIIVDGIYVNYGNVCIDKKVKGDKFCIVIDLFVVVGVLLELESFIFVGKMIYIKEGCCFDVNGIIVGVFIIMMEFIKNVVEYVEILFVEVIWMSNFYLVCVIGVDDCLGLVEKGKVVNLVVFSLDYNVIGIVVNGKWKVN